MRKALQQIAQSVLSEVNRDFVSNPFPRRRECITISLRVAKEAAVDDVWLRGLSDGIVFRMRMDRGKRGSLFRYYTVGIEMACQTLSYRFEIKSGQYYLYYTARGTQTVPPPEDADFVIIADISYPEWVAGAVFYQIIPDRFNSGDPNVGVQDDEYQFDGVSVQTVSWDEAPPEYDEGRCLDFYNGDLAGIGQSIPHFQSLGIDALYLTPIFSARTNHRYDCIDYFQVDEHLGGNSALESLMGRLHSRGIRAILDLSINHTGIEHPWFKKAYENPSSPEADYYYLQSDGTFVYWWDIPTLPKLNYGSQQLRNLMWENENALVRYYVKPPYCVDGWRFDVASEVGRWDDDQYCELVWRGVRRAVKAINPQAYILGEHWEDSTSYLQGDQWDGVMNYAGSGRPLRSWLGELDRFLMENWGHDPVKTTPYTAEQLAQALTQYICKLPNQLVFVQFNLIDSHDTPRVHHHAAVYRWNLYAGAVMLLFTLPGAVCYLYGDEVGLAGHPHSVEGARYPMQWDKKKWNMEHFQLYSALGKIRSDFRELFAFGAFCILLAQGDTLACARLYRGRAVVTVVNRSPEVSDISVPVGRIGAVSASSLLGGEEPTVSKGKLSVHLEPEQSALILCECEN
ncbi:MAG: alpha-amylase family glycosyl hydrolase [Spirochaetota bacterium]